MREFLARLNEAEMTRLAEYRNHEGEVRSMPVGDLLHHAMMHGVHHRGQLALLLRMLGHAPGDFDILYYYADQRGVPAW